MTGVLISLAVFVGFIALAWLYHKGEEEEKETGSKTTKTIALVAMAVIVIVMLVLAFMNDSD